MPACLLEGSAGGPLSAQGKGSCEDQSPGSWRPQAISTHPFQRERALPAKDSCLSKVQAAQFTAGCHVRHSGLAQGWLCCTHETRLGAIRASLSGSRAASPTFSHTFPISWRGGVARICVALHAITLWPGVSAYSCVWAAWGLVPALGSAS